MLLSSTISYYYIIMLFDFKVTAFNDFFGIGMCVLVRVSLSKRERERVDSLPFADICTYIQ